MTMASGIAFGLSTLAVAVAALWVGFLVAMRTKFGPVQRAVRRMNRAVLNPRTMETAGQPGASASVVRHLGRSTGTAYETPVETVATDDGFVIALPYGASADWLKNVLAAGTAMLVHDGEVHTVDHPELVPASVGNPHFSPRGQRSHRWFGVDDFLMMRRAVDSEEEVAESV
jgi:deazaflavin-dependent oxidoreductase (nitroreductase family)